MSTPVGDSRLSRVVAVINSKGGVGKTSITANVGGQLAKAGVRVLLIDLCSQGNLELELGYQDQDGADQGWGTVAAVVRQEPLKPMEQVRDNLDVVPGGAHLNLLNTATEPQIKVFADAIGTLADAQGYDLVLIDCSPVNLVLQKLALAAAQYVIIPTRTDPASWDGVVRVAPEVAEARRQYNPRLTYLGVVIFAVGSGATRVRRATQTELSGVAAQIPTFRSTIRYSEAAAQDARMRGRLIHELAGDSRGAQRRRLTWLGQKQQQRGVLDPADSLTSPATLKALGEDYLSLAGEVLDKISYREQADQG